MERAELSERLGAGRLRSPGRGTVVCEADPVRFQSVFADAVAAGGPVFLADPAWRESERREFAALIASHPAGTTDPEEDRGWLCLPTGGSSGRIKLARHDGYTVAAAVGGFARYFGCQSVSAAGFLPLHHVSGLMAWLRAVMTGGRFRIARWEDVVAGQRPDPPSGDAFVSVVPTQLQRLLLQPEAVAWLRSFRTVFVGGGPVWPDLLDSAARGKLPLALSYGMTETAAMVTALPPEEFALGLRSAGQALPHARVTCDADGTIAVSGESLFRGYFPAFRTGAAEWKTADTGSIDSRGHLHVLGRRDAVIMTGGEKVDPVTVETVLRATGQFQDVVVVGVPDPLWGQVVVACYPEGEPAPDWAQLRSRVEVELSGYRRPKRYVAVAEWPRNAQGKVNREILRQSVLRTSVADSAGGEDRSA